MTTPVACALARGLIGAFAAVRFFAVVISWTSASAQGSKAAERFHRHAPRRDLVGRERLARQQRHTPRRRRADPAWLVSATLQGPLRRASDPGRGERNCGRGRSHPSVLLRASRAGYATACHGGRAADGSQSTGSASSLLAAPDTRRHRDTSSDRCCGVRSGDCPPDSDTSWLLAAFATR
jgi:hypothetical protein